MKLPTVQECFHYFDHFAMLANIRAHSIMVARMAEALYEALASSPSSGPTTLPAKEEVIIGALMHDIAKTPCLGTELSHAQEGERICIELGYPELGEIVVEHVLLRNFPEEQYEQGIFGGKELIYYADKRVNHDQPVTLAARQEYIITRYGRNEEWRKQRIYENFATAFKLEQYLFCFLPFPPEELENYLNTSSDTFGLKE